MKTLAEQMGFYAAYHQDRRNKATHFVGVPTIVASLMIPLGWLRWELAGVSVSGAVAVAAILVAYYLVLDVPLGLAMCAVFALLLVATEPLAQAPLATGLAWFLALFVGGWILQLVGHAFEGRRPALVDNLFQIFVAPIFLVAEAFFTLGYKPHLQREVEAHARALRARAAESPARGET
ncbi:MAG: DUF962 domain-containing protein [Burkholderiales bacterium]|nr:DUF962 domain-containing protein [Burkholderiales bacterium]